MANNNPQVGEIAPDFTLPDQNGDPIRLKDQLGKGALVLYFYPKDDSMGCTIEACTFRDSYTAFTDAGVQVIGVSKDSVESHQKFIKHHHLPFTLLSDGEGTVTKLYGAEMAFGLIRGRITFLIDRDGVIRHRISDVVNMPRHANEMLTLIREMEISR